MRRALVLIVLLAGFGGLLPLAVDAAAPARTQAWCTSMGVSCPGGLPYAEAAKCAEANIIACEDFNGGPTFFPRGQQINGSPPTLCGGSCKSAWFNPAQTGIGTLTTGVDTYGGGNRYINAATTYIAKPQGSMPSNGSDYVWVSNHDTGVGLFGNNNGASWLYLKDLGVSCYQYGNCSAVNEYHIRFQVYFTDTINSDHATWVSDGFPKTDPYTNSTSTCLGVKFLFVYTPGGRVTPASSSTDGGLGSGCGWFDGHLTTGAGPSGARYGNGLQLFTCGGPCNYETSPMCYTDAPGNVNTVCSGAGNHGPSHMEYGGYLSTSVSSRPNDTPTPGRVWRWNTGQWYTWEYHVKYSNPPSTRNGVGEVWVDGTRIYSMTDLLNCASSSLSSDNCITNGIGAVYLSTYTNAAQGDTTPFNGQMIVDNLVIAAGDTYIGPPSTGTSPDTTPPAPPTGVTISSLFRSLLEWLFA